MATAMRRGVIAGVNRLRGSISTAGSSAVTLNTEQLTALLDAVVNELELEENELQRECLACGQPRSETRAREPAKAFAGKGS